MTKLSVNINKIATIRNARGGNNPDVALAAVNCIKYGADGITVHPRPDERHIRRSDVYAIKEKIDKEFNIEGYPTPEFMELVLKVKPAQVTLVPDALDAITSNSGWDTIKNRSFLTEIVTTLQEKQIRTSIFVNADPVAVEYAAKIGTDRVELYTEPYASMYETDKEAAVKPFVEAAETARRNGLGLNAGHDLNLDNLAYFHRAIPYLDEVSIGHALVCDALYLGLEETIKRYQQALHNM